MATDIAKAYVQIVPSAQGIKGKISEALGGEAESAGKESGGKFASAMGAALKVGGAAIAAGAAALTAAITKGVSETAAYGDEIDKMSQKMGLSAQAYQEWDAIMQHSGTSIESLQSGMKTLANAVESENGAFERLGITQEQIASMNNEELFSATITALQNVDNETERTYLAGQLLGRGATELGALLNTSAEDTEAMRQRVHELGGVMSDEAVKAAAAYQDSLQDMKTAVSGVGREMMSELLPSVTSVMDGLTEVFAGDSKKGLGMISEGLNGVVSQISAAVPKIVELASGIVLPLVQAIIDNLPALLTAGAELVSTLTSGILEMLPTIINAGLELILTLATGIADSLPELIPTIVDVVLQIVDTLTDPGTLGALIDASIAIILALAGGLIDALPRLLEKAPVIIANLVTAIAENFPKLLKAGMDVLIQLVTGIIDNLPELGKAAGQIIKAVVTGIIDLWANLLDVGGQIVAGIWDGINEKWAWLKEKVSGFFSGIVGGVKDLLGIASPSKVFAGIGENMALGLGQGFEGEMHDVQQDIQGAVGSAIGSVQDSFALGLRADVLGANRQVMTAERAQDISTADAVSGLVNSLQAMGGGGTYTVNLVLPDGTVLARFLLPALIDAARAGGTPILNPA